MYRIIECLGYEHNHGLVLLAAMVCIVGSGLSAQLLSRTCRAKGHQRTIKLLLTAMISGATIWSTHFIAMLAYEPVFEHAYEPGITTLSLLVAILGMAISIFVTVNFKPPAMRLVGGAFFGLTVTLMHYLGMSAYLLPGQIVWYGSLVVASVIVGASLGACAFFAISQPRPTYMWRIGAALMVLTICSMHFTAMGAIEIELDPRIVVPPQVISDMTLSFLVVGVTAAVLLIGLAALLIETGMEYETDGKLRDAAMHDPLTQLPNRLKLKQKMADLSELLELEPGARAAILTIDLDLFKDVNDLYGHGAGDFVLTNISTAMTSVLDQDEFLARVGGDEFVAIKTRFRRLDEVQAFAHRLRAQILEPIQIEQGEISIGASIGISSSLDNGSDTDQLLHYSDLAMYRAKSGGDKKVCFYNPEMDKQNRDKLFMVNDLRQAVPNNELELVYQLQNNIQTLAPEGFEVLLRWNHPERGLISPANFIPLAEETGLIRDIGLWVLRTACMEAASWEKPFGIAVNVAPQQLVQPSFLEHVSDILLESALDPTRLELEVTEASIIDDQKNTLKVMHKLKQMGIRIAMDDFGTGYSSLATLQAFPFDKIKIDRSFVQDVHSNIQRAAIVRSTLLLGDALNIPVLAEGVEQEDELQFLQRENCASVQGFYFGKPMSLADARVIVGRKAQQLDGQVA